MTPATADPKLHAEAVLFDAAGTLVFAEPSVPEIIARLLREAGAAADIRKIAQAQALVESAHGVPDDAPDRPTRRRYWTAHIHRIVSATDAAPDDRVLTAVAQAAADAVLDPAGYRLMPGALELLDRVDAAGKPKAIVSNFDDLLFEILDAVGLSARFPVVVSSFRFGAYKPEPAIFHEAAHRIGADRRDTCFLGDSPYSDMVGAARAGMTGVLFDPADARRDFAGRRVRSLAQFGGLIDVWRDPPGAGRDDSAARAADLGGDVGL